MTAATGFGRSGEGPRFGGPGGEQYLPVALVGKTSRDFDASETITQFFLGL